MLEEYGTFLTTREASKLLHLTEWTIRDMCRRGTLPSAVIGRRVLIPRDELERYIKERLAARNWRDE